MPKMVQVKIIWNHQVFSPPQGKSELYNAKPASNSEQCDSAYITAVSQLIWMTVSTYCITAN